MITLEDVKKNPQILEFINQTEQAMEALRYTNHGIRHSNLVSQRAMEIAKAVGLDAREGELAAIAGFCHDMGNFLTRTFHHFFGAQLFSQVFMGKCDPGELAMIMQAISNHDKEEMNFSNKISALLVLADKSDVHRSRVAEQSIEETKSDIHDRVNYATTNSSVKVDKAKKRITLTLKIDTNFCPVIEYFEIFTERMVFCRKAAQFLGYDFGLVINSFRLL
ncbi:MAG: HD domain-containing protein [Candidatus Staskawiczbacteria bacterium]|nr:HD domain-containing protein [Candidatus Staskawiczbacteria bacterium]